jgi:hypothetical protein
MTPAPPPARQTQKEHDDGEISSPWIAVVLYGAGWLAIAIACFEALASLASAGSTAAIGIVFLGFGAVVSLLNRISVRLTWMHRLQIGKKTVD